MKCFLALEMTDRQLAIHNALLEYSAKNSAGRECGRDAFGFEKQLNMYYDQKGYFG